ncbi:MAG: HAMP domain-containing histidine kinase [Bacteroides sp.]|nr:HAMP domain-containing histidine kinase [Bacteroides sp.]
MKLPLKLITVLVLISLTGIFLYQGYWLVRLYQTLKEEMERNIHTSIQISDYNEMLLRIEALRNSSVTGSISTSIGIQNDTATVTTERVTDTDTVSKLSMLRTHEGMGVILHKNQDVQSLQNYFQKGLHASLDSYIDPDLQRFDSLLTLELISHGITSPHLTQVIYFYDPQEEEIMEEFTSDTSYIPSARATHYDRFFDIHNRRGYRIWLEPVGSAIATQMRGILATSVVILCILSFSFWYLIRTLLRQKTLEEMKSDFTNNITHELKTPIAIAYAANDALLHFNQAEKKEKREKYLHICQDQLERLSRLVEQILNTSMEQRSTFHLDKQPVPLYELVNELMEQHRLKADKPVYFDCNIEPADLTVTADRAHLGNILSNLIDNAVRYSTPEAHISIRAEATSQGIKIRVADRGIGIAPEKQKYIFDKFYRVPTGNLHEVKGYGLGLYYVRALMEKHAGGVYMESRPGGGSVFTLLFPGK